MNTWGYYPHYPAYSMKRVFVKFLESIEQMDHYPDILVDDDLDKEHTEIQILK